MAPEQLGYQLVPWCESRSLLMGLAQERATEDMHPAYPFLKSCRFSVMAG